MKIEISPTYLRATIWLDPHELSMIVLALGESADNSRRQGFAGTAAILNDLEAKISPRCIELLDAEREKADADRAAYMASEKTPDEIGEGTVEKTEEVTMKND